MNTGYVDGMKELLIKVSTIRLQAIKDVMDKLHKDDDDAAKRLELYRRCRGDVFWCLMSDCRQNLNTPLMPKSGEPLVGKELLEFGWRIQEELLKKASEAVPCKYTVIKNYRQKEDQLRPESLYYQTLVNPELKEAEKATRMERRVPKISYPNAMPIMGIVLNDINVQLVIAQLYAIKDLDIPVAYCSIVKPRVQIDYYLEEMFYDTYTRTSTEDFAKFNQAVFDIVKYKHLII